MAVPIARQTGDDVCHLGIAGFGLSRSRNDSQGRGNAEHTEKTLCDQVVVTGLPTFIDDDLATENGDLIREHAIDVVSRIPRQQYDVGNFTRL